MHEVLSVCKSIYGCKSMSACESDDVMAEDSSLILQHYYIDMGCIMHAGLCPLSIQLTEYIYI